MELIHGAVALLSAVVLIVACMVAWLYVQQTRLSQAINALAFAMTAPPPSYPSEPVPEAPVEQEDDRVTIEDDDDVVEVEGVDVAELKSKTIVQLREMLTEKGIPFNKSDKKSTLISLVQAAS